jgi:transcriptional regulator with XRE-family HTH domain
MDESGLGGEFRALRVAAGRTVASVAADAGLSVPYIANLENGRGNPTVGALSRLAAALGRRLVVRLSGEAAGEPAEVGKGDDNSKKPPAAIPGSLIRFTRTQRFRRVVAAMGETAGPGGDGGGAADGDGVGGDGVADGGGAGGERFAARVIGGLAGLAGVFDRDLGEEDWARLLDALFLVSADPRGG